ncbi:MAG: c-type cytochrome [Gemmatimonadetes bacterium]|nr:c-type cytochrome [Gemmatimonadota bacterium]
MKPVIRRIGYGLGALVVIAVVAAVAAVAAVAVYIMSQRILGATMAIVVQPITVPTDSASIARGRHLARAIGKCADCHGDDLGGTTVFDVAPIGRWTSANLTPGGAAANRTDAEIAHALRHGVDPKGRKLFMMPSYEYSYFSEPDLAAVIAYLRSLPAVDRRREPLTVGPVARALMVAGALPMLDANRIDHSMPIPDRATGRPDG